MLTGIDPILTGDLLAHLDAMGPSDAVVVADARFPTARLATRSLIIPALPTPAVVAAVHSVVPLDDPPALDLMAAPGERRLPVQEQLIAAARAFEPDASVAAAACYRSWTCDSWACDAVLGCSPPRRGLQLIYPITE